MQSNFNTCELLLVNEWMKHKLESRYINNLNIQMTPHMAESEEQLKGLLMKVKRRVKKLA